jgi:hypothetical protein
VISPAVLHNDVKGEGLQDLAQLPRTRSALVRWTRDATEGVRLPTGIMRKSGLYPTSCYLS